MKKLFKEKTSRVILTADTPGWNDNLFMGRPAIKQFKLGTLAFTGFKPVKVIYIAPMKESIDAFRTKWLEKVYALGQKRA